ncbi:hypothetical protein [Modestobacter sp. SYSU DS0511]
MTARPDRPTQQVLLLLLGLVVLVVALTDQHLAYVRGAFQPFLVMARVLLVVVGGLGLLRDRGRRSDHLGPGVGWLLAAPVAVLVVVAPRPWGPSPSTSSRRSRWWPRRPRERGSARTTPAPTTGP